MDVVVTPAPGSQREWHLTDRLGRHVGQITQFAENQFLISAADRRPDAPLAKMDATHRSLGAAMDAIAHHMKGSCQFADEKDR
jgi:hypothetical protein